MKAVALGASRPGHCPGTFSSPVQCHSSENPAQADPVNRHPIFFDPTKRRSIVLGHLGRIVLRGQHDHARAVRGQRSGPAERKRYGSADRVAAQAHAADCRKRHRATARAVAGRAPACRRGAIQQGRLAEVGRQTAESCRRRRRNSLRRSALARQPAAHDRLLCHVGRQQLCLAREGHLEARLGGAELARADWSRSRAQRPRSIRSLSRF